MVKKDTLTPQQALQKTKQYCAYQERCHKEVKEKLYGFGLTTNEVEASISALIEENYLNEERFAIAYAGGKFRMKQWGRQKIKYSLQQKQVSSYCIKKALALIDEDAYMATLQKELEARKKLLKGEKNIFIKKRKISDYLQQKGFELSLINDCLKTV